MSVQWSGTVVIARHTRFSRIRPGHPEGLRPAGDDGPRRERKDQSPGSPMDPYLIDICLTCGDVRNTLHQAIFIIHFDIVANRFINRWPAGVIRQGDGGKVPVLYGKIIGAESRHGAAGERIFVMKTAAIEIVLPLPLAVYKIDAGIRLAST